MIIAATSVSILAGKMLGDAIAAERQTLLLSPGLTRRDADLLIGRNTETVTACRCDNVEEAVRVVRDYLSKEASGTSGE